MKYSSFITLVILLFTCSYALAFNCPESLVSEEGEKPIMQIRSKDGEKSVVVCGWVNEDKRISETEFETSEFMVFSSGEKDSLLYFGAVDFCRIKKEESRLIITELKSMPFGDEECKWVPTDFIKYEVSFDGTNSVVVKKYFVFSPPKLNQIQIDQILAEYQEKKDKKEVSYKLNELMGLMLAAAINGNETVEKLLLNMSKDFELDGAVSEYYKEVIQIYKKYQKEK